MLIGEAGMRNVTRTAAALAAVLLISCVSAYAAPRVTGTCLEKVKQVLERYVSQYFWCYPGGRCPLKVVRNLSRIDLREFRPYAVFTGCDPDSVERWAESRMQFFTHPPTQIVVREGRIMLTSSYSNDEVKLVVKKTTADESNVVVYAPATPANGTFMLTRVKGSLYLVGVEPAACGVVYVLRGTGEATLTFTTPEAAAHGQKSVASVTVRSSAAPPGKPFTPQSPEERCGKVLRTLWFTRRYLPSLANGTLAFQAWCTFKARTADQEVCVEAGSGRPWCWRFTYPYDTDTPRGVYCDASGCLVVQEEKNGRYGWSWERGAAAVKRYCSPECVREVFHITRP